MKSKIITTNLRMPEEEWLQIRMAAAELGMSANEYINHLIKKVSLKIELAEDKNCKTHPIWDLPKAYTNGKGFDLSDDDKTVYG